MPLSTPSRRPRPDAPPIGVAFKAEAATRAGPPAPRPPRSSGRWSPWIGSILVVAAAWWLVHSRHSEIPAPVPPPQTHSPVDANPAPPAAETGARLLDDQQAIEIAAANLARRLERALPTREAADFHTLRAAFGDPAWLRDGLADSTRAAASPDLQAEWEALARRAAALDDALAGVDR